MKYFTKLDTNNIVTAVNCVHDNDAPTESDGIEFLKQLFNEPDSVWKQTFKNGSERKNFASNGYTYDADRDAFIYPKPHSSWILNEDTCCWVAPVDVPGDASAQKRYVWNEETTSWDLVT